MRPSARSSLPFAPDAFSADRFVLDCRTRTLDCRPGTAGGPGPHVMGILNVTPDSFSDGGQYQAVEDAVSRAAEMLSDGASIIDIGGESTRPGADPISAQEERDRVLPVVEALADRFPDALLSVDTYKPEVARPALEAGAPLVVMHSAGEPGDLTSPREYDDVVAEVRDALARSIETAQEAGVASIIIDPGFGFGKTHAQNLRLVNEIDELMTLDRPVLLGVSRKSTIGATLGSDEDRAPVDNRLFGSLGATAVGVMRGATLVRTHDVAATVEMLRVLDATMRASQ